MADVDKMIGRYKPEGGIESWPETNIDGGRYDRTANRLGLSGNRFVVLAGNKTDMQKLKDLGLVEPEPTPTPPAETPAFTDLDTSFRPQQSTRRTTRDVQTSDDS